MVVAVLSLCILLGVVGQVWALSVTPSSPIAGQEFYVDSGAVIAELISVYSGPGCSGTIIVSGTVPAGGSYPFRDKRPGSIARIRILRLAV